MTAAELKASILDLAVRGQLVPQDPKDKPAAKQSDIDDPPYELPRNWVWKQLKDLGGFHGGHTPSMSDRSLWGGDILWVSSKDVKSNEIWDTQDKLTPRGAELLEEVCVDSLVMVTRSGILKHTFPVAVVKNNCRINQDLKAFVPADKRFSPFLAWCLRGLQPFILKHYRKNGTTVQSIVWDEFIRMPIPLPPLAEQKRIVAKIEELLPLVEEYGAAQKELEALNADFPAALRESILQDAVQGKLTAEWRRARFERFETARELLDQIAAEKKRLLAAKKIKKEKPLPPITDDEKPFEIPDTWAWCRLGEIGITQTGSTPSTKNKAFYGKDIPFIKPADIYDDHIDYENCGLSFAGAAAGRVIAENSILMVCIGTIGKTYFTDRKVSCNQQINAITPFGIDVRFLLIAMQSPYFQMTAWDESSSTTLSILNKSTWSNIAIPLPPLAEQKAIVERVDELLKIVDAMKAQ